ncbi:hypothetical protein ENU1_041570 [Entamoeba nuttalli P19]|uniref:Uncharacterized protein n=1 Tax=Entamoeba nuttalli (strain P19) TaxID=1076696 RepID=K2HZK5_ENTNP|nr:hypothetical protein ENU1_041570 [Entamoeba nuttalli P19]EKE41875.1 hypothetical protein ENU1_041570 [Entamoeba nuttalli P19]|eukprot:XP_008855790.1 hypothetical protein ENU1_041570 [Entamoeba nuttalli P19]
MNKPQSINFEALDDNCPPEQLPESWKIILREAGVKKKDLQNPETRKKVYAYMRQSVYVKKTQEELDKQKVSAHDVRRMSVSVKQRYKVIEGKQRTQPNFVSAKPQTDVKQSSFLSTRQPHMKSPNTTPQHQTQSPSVTSTKTTQALFQKTSTSPSIKFGQTPTKQQTNVENSPTRIKTPEKPTLTNSKSPESQQPITPKPTGYGSKTPSSLTTQPKLQTKSNSMFSKKSVKPATTSSTTNKPSSTSTPTVSTPSSNNVSSTQKSQNSSSFAPHAFGSKVDTSAKSGSVNNPTHFVSSPQPQPITKKSFTTPSSSTLKQTTPSQPQSSSINSFNKSSVVKQTTTSSVNTSKPLTSKSPTSSLNENKVSTGSHINSTISSPIKQTQPTTSQTLQTRKQSLSSSHQISAEQMKQPLFKTSTNTQKQQPSISKQESFSSQRVAKSPEPALKDVSQNVSKSTEPAKTNTTVKGIQKQCNSPVKETESSTVQETIKSPKTQQPNIEKPIVSKHQSTASQPKLLVNLKSSPTSSSPSNTNSSEKEKVDLSKMSFVQRQRYLREQQDLEAQKTSVTRNAVKPTPSFKKSATQSSIIEEKQKEGMKQETNQQTEEVDLSKMTFVQRQRWEREQQDKRAEQTTAKSHGYEAKFAKQTSTPKDIVYQDSHEDINGANKELQQGNEEDQCVKPSSMGLKSSAAQIVAQRKKLPKSGKNNTLTGSASLNAYIQRQEQYKQDEIEREKIRMEMQRKREEIQRKQDEIRKMREETEKQHKKGEERLKQEEERFKKEEEERKKKEEERLRQEEEENKRIKEERQRKEEELRKKKAEEERKRKLEEEAQKSRRRVKEERRGRKKKKRSY